MNKYPWIDMHCDSLLRANREGAKSLWDGEGHQSLKRLAENGQMAQFFAIFFRPKTTQTEKGNTKDRNAELPDDTEYFMKLRQILLDQLALHHDQVRLALSTEEIKEHMADGIASAVLTIEDGRMIDNDLSRISWLRDMGVRTIGLTWNSANCLGFPNSPDPAGNHRGLTPFGRDAVLEMNRLGILVDVSHLSDGGFDDVAKLSRKPFIASHSNARAVTNHPRNLTDSMLKKMADKGGVTGLNFVPEFLNEQDLPGTVSMLMEHARHIVNIAGEDTLGIGADFDGFRRENEIGNSTKMSLLFQAMEKVFTPRQIEKFTSGNVLRVLADAEA